MEVDAEARAALAVRALRRVCVRYGVEKVGAVMAARRARRLAAAWATWSRAAAAAAAVAAEQRVSRRLRVEADALRARQGVLERGLAEYAREARDAAVRAAVWRWSRNAALAALAASTAAAVAPRKRTGGADATPAPTADGGSRTWDGSEVAVAVARGSHFADALVAAVAAAPWGRG